jgi:hypothetical protein
LIVAVALIGLWFFWRWMKIRETQQLLDARPLEITTVEPVSPPLNMVSNQQYQLAKPRDNVRRWLEEVKRKLLTTKKDDDDHPES